MTKRKSGNDPGAFNKGTLVNVASIFGGLVVSGFIYVVGNWALYGDTLKRHDVILSKLADTVSSLDKTVAVLGEQNKQIAQTLTQMVKK